MFLLKELTALEKNIINYSITNRTISKTGVDWHIDHCLKVINGIYYRLEKSNPAEYKWKFNLNRYIVFIINRIPRGKGKAPKSVVAEGIITIEELEKQLNVAKEKLKTIDTLPAKSNFIHPYFGQLNLPMTKWFLKIHTQHHLKIIEDIIQKK
ncbi:MAG: hypothetical protein J0M08_09720 [Bacteroidetes bacterium]|nr:hypothetical protein [Bacteroidota bacterium]